MAASKCCEGPGYASPLDASRYGPRETILYVTCARYKAQKPDFLATVDVDPHSPTFCQIVGQVVLPYVGDEVHHSGWNACSSCFGVPGVHRSHFILPCLNSSRIYVIDTTTDPRAPTLYKTIEPEVLLSQGLSFPHTTHCLPDGNIMVSTLGDQHGNAQGNFALFDSKTFESKGIWNKQPVRYGYDYWYQPKHHILVSSAWGAPRVIKEGFDPSHVPDFYGSELNFWEWGTGRFLKKIDLGPEGALPLEVRFLHDPKSTHGFVGCALSSSVFHIDKTGDGDWTAEKVIEVPSKSVSGWMMSQMPGLITDILISLDDRFLYFSNWLHGDIRQYDISNPSQPKLVGQVFLCGSLEKDGPVKITQDEELKAQPDSLHLKGKKIEGGPQMLQLSLDGKRLYVTTSLYSAWDKQFYPEMAKKGSVMMMLDVETEGGGLKLNREFLVDFGEAAGGPSLAHEIRYPGGDCSSDVWLDKSAHY